MSLTGSNLIASQSFRRRKTALFGRLRQNLFLKTVALFTSIILYFYVQAEHNPNPIVSVDLPVQLKCINMPDSMLIDPDDKTINVKIAGPRVLVENLRDSDINATVDLHSVPPVNGMTPPLVPRYDIPALKHEALQQLHFEPVTVKLHLQAIIHQSMAVQPVVPPIAPGSHYGRIEIIPNRVVCYGREDYVNRVSRLIIRPVIPLTGQINDLYTVIPLDKNDNPVSDVQLEPEQVRAKIPVLMDDPVQYAIVSPDITSLPTLPYQIDGVTVDPQRVKIVGKPGLNPPPAYIMTRSLDLHKLNQDVDLYVDLMKLPDTIVYDLNGHPISQVRIHCKIIKINDTPSPQPPLNQP